jgi:deoxyadenosine/deoxycytidine kinase
LKSKKYFVGIAGNIGVGKTTATSLIAEQFGWEPHYESVIDNPYLEDFYSDMQRWSFNLQIYFLAHRFHTHQKLAESKLSCIQDRTIYEDVEIFARTLHEMGNMSARDWKTYKALFEEMVNFLRKPDLIIYLRASIDTLITRIRRRSRDFEREISPEYLYTLNLAYERWIKRQKEKSPVMIVEMSEFDIIEDRDKFEQLLKDIRKFCPE